MDLLLWIRYLQWLAVDFLNLMLHVVSLGLLKVFSIQKPKFILLGELHQEFLNVRFLNFFAWVRLGQFQGVLDWQNSAAGLELDCGRRIDNYFEDFVLRYFCLQSFDPGFGFR